MNCTKAEVEATAVTGHKNRNVFKINSVRAAMKIGVSGQRTPPEEVCTLPPRLAGDSLPAGPADSSVPEPAHTCGTKAPSDIFRCSEEIKA